MRLVLLLLLLGGAELGMAVDTTVYILGFEGTDDNYPYHGRIWSFDTAANGGQGAWGASPETDEMTDPPIRSHDSYDWRGNFFVRYDNGDFGVLYKEEIAGGNATGRLFYRLWNGSWQDAIEIIPTLDHPTVGTIIYEQSTEKIYLFYHLQWRNEDDLRLRTIGHDETISGDLYEFPSAPIANSGQIAGAGLIHDGVMMLVWSNDQDVTNAIWEWDMSGTVSFTKTLLPLYPDETNNPVEGAIIYGNNELPVAIHIHGQLPGRLYMSERSVGGTWGAPTIIFADVDVPDLYTRGFGYGSQYVSQSAEMGIMLREKQGPSDADNELWFLRNGAPYEPVIVSSQVAYSITGAPLPGQVDHRAPGAQYINGAYWFFGNGWADGDPRNIAAIRSGDKGVTWTLQDTGNAPSLGKWGWINDTYVGEGEQEEEEEGVGLEFGDENPGPGECAVVTRSETADVESEEEPADGVSADIVSEEEPREQEGT